MLKPTFPEPPVWPPPASLKARRSGNARECGGSPNQHLSPASTSRARKSIDRKGSSVLEEAIARDIHIVDRAIHIPGYRPRQHRSRAKEPTRSRGVKSRSRKTRDISTSSASETESSCSCSCSSYTSSTSGDEDTSTSYDSDTSELDTTSESSSSWTDAESETSTSKYSGSVTSSAVSSSTSSAPRHRGRSQRKPLKRGHRRSGRETAMCYSRPAHTMYREVVPNASAHIMSRGSHARQYARHDNGRQNYDNSSSTATRVVLKASEALLNNSRGESADPATKEVSARGVYDEPSARSGEVYREYSAARNSPPPPIGGQASYSGTGGYGSEVKFDAYIQRPKKNALCCA